MFICRQNCLKLHHLNQLTMQWKNIKNVVYRITSITEKDRLNETRSWPFRSLIYAIHCLKTSNFLTAKDF